MNVIGRGSKVGLFAMLIMLASQLAFSQTVIKTSPSYMSQSYVMNPQISGHGPHSFKIATLYANNVGDDDHLHIVANVNSSWAANANASIDALFGNRG